MSTSFNDNPAKVLEALYRRVYDEEMRELPIVNPAIEVEAHGFVQWDGHWVGVLITPWFINLLILRHPDHAWPTLKLGKGNDRSVAFPAGVIDFTPRFEPELGMYLCRSLASPMTEYNSHQQALESARQVMRELTAIPLAVDATEQPASPSRRAFLAGQPTAVEAAQ